MTITNMVAQAQQYHPQFWDNSSVGSYADYLKNDDIQSESVLLKLQLVLDGDDMPQTMYLQHLYRIYEIEQTATIDYVTVSGEPLPWSDNDKTVTDLFGAELSSNDKNSKKSKNEDGTIVYTLEFKQPVKRIPGELFQYDVCELRLPGQTDIVYTPSDKTNVARLKSLTGGGVTDGILVSSNGTCITAATAGKTVSHLPEDVRQIAPWAFRGAQAKELYLPSQIQSIGENAFANTQLKSLYIMAETPPAISDNDLQALLQTTVYVPKKQVKVYKKAWPVLKKRLKSMKVK